MIDDVTNGRCTADEPGGPCRRQSVGYCFVAHSNDGALKHARRCGVPRITPIIGGSAWPGFTSPVAEVEVKAVRVPAVHTDVLGHPGHGMGHIFVVVAILGRTRRRPRSVARHRPRPGRQPARDRGPHRQHGRRDHHPRHAHETEVPKAVDTCPHDEPQPDTSSPTPISKGSPTKPNAATTQPSSSPAAASADGPPSAAQAHPLSGPSASIQSSTTRSPSEQGATVSPHQTSSAKPCVATGTPAVVQTITTPDSDMANATISVRVGRSPLIAGWECSVQARRPCARDPGRPNGPSTESPLLRIDGYSE